MSGPEKARILAVIPARGGSKGVPRKNLHYLAGKPLIAHTIEAARASRVLSTVIVSTEDEDIAEVATRWGSHVPFLRPRELARDETPQTEVVLHALHALEEADGERYDVVVLLQPTAPLRQPEDIDAAVFQLLRVGGDAVVSFSPVWQDNPYYAYTIDQDRPVPLFPEMEGVPRRQVLPAVYRRNGAIYAILRDALLRDRSFLLGDVRAYIMPIERSINIDTPLDFVLAEVLQQRMDRGSTWS